MGSQNFIYATHDSFPDETTEMYFPTYEKYDCIHYHSRWWWLYWEFDKFWHEDNREQLNYPYHVDGFWVRILPKRFDHLVKCITRGEEYDNYDTRDYPYLTELMQHDQNFITVTRAYLEEGYDIYYRNDP